MEYGARHVAKSVGGKAAGPEPQNQRLKEANMIDASKAMQAAKTTTFISSICFTYAQS